MTLFLANIILALIWSFATGQVTTGSIVIGYIVGYGVLWLAKPVVGESRYFEKFPLAVGFFLFYVRQLLLSNLRVAYDVMTRTHYMKPGFIAVPLDARTNTEITLLANLLTMTPGTLGVDVSDDRRVLYIHAMYIDDPDQFRREIKDGFERRLLEVLR